MQCWSVTVKPLSLNQWPPLFFRPASLCPRGSVDSALDLGPRGPEFKSPRGKPWKNFYVGKFSFLFFLNPLASTIKVWRFFFLGKNFLFKSILAWCEQQTFKEIIRLFLSEIIEDIELTNKTKKISTLYFYLFARWDESLHSFGQNVLCPRARAFPQL